VIDVFRLVLIATALAASLLAGDPMLLILHKGASSLGFYTLEGKLETMVPVGEHPHEMVRSPDGRRMYTTDNGTMRIEQAGTGGNTVSIIDLPTRRRIGQISLGNFRRPHGIDIDSTGKRLVVSTELPDQLLLIDIEKRRVVRTFDTKGKTSHMVVLGPQGRWAYVSNSTSNNISAVNLATGEVRLIPCPPRPEGSVLSQDGRHVYVASREGRAVTILDTRTQTAAGAIAAGNGPVRIARTPEGTLVWAAMHDHAVEIADPVSRKVAARVVAPCKGGLVSLHISQDGKFALTSAEDDDTVYVISIAERKIVRQIKTEAGAAPDPAMLVTIE
jgi:YVTN family beta-propeller protein